MWDVRKNISDIAYSKGIKQHALGEIWGVNQSNAGKILNGALRLNYSHIELFAAAVGMDVVDVITYPRKYVPSDGAGRDEEISQKDAVISNLNAYIARLNDDIARYKDEIGRLKSHAVNRG